MSLASPRIYHLILVTKLLYLLRNHTHLVQSMVSRNLHRCMWLLCGLYRQTHVLLADYNLVLSGHNSNPSWKLHDCFLRMLSWKHSCCLISNFSCHSICSFPSSFQASSRQDFFDQESPVQSVLSCDRIPIRISSVVPAYTWSSTAKLSYCWAVLHSPSLTRTLRFYSLELSWVSMWCLYVKYLYVEEIVWYC